MAHPTGLDAPSGTRSHSDRQRQANRFESRDLAPVFVRVPYLEIDRPGGSTKPLQPAAPAEAERPGRRAPVAHRPSVDNATGSPPADREQPTGESDSVRAPRGDPNAFLQPQRRVSAAEHALRRVRQQAKAAPSHTVRNIVVLVVVLISAASLTVWLMRGGSSNDSQPSRTSTLQTRPLDAPAIEEWETTQRDLSRGSDVKDQWAWDSAKPHQGASSMAPRVDFWPPSAAVDDPSIDPLGPVRRFAPAGPEADVVVPDDSRAFASPGSHQRPQRERTPVASLNGIEPVPVLR